MLQSFHFGLLAFIALLFRPFQKSFFLILFNACQSGIIGNIVHLDESGQFIHIYLAFYSQFVMSIF